MSAILKDEQGVQDDPSKMPNQECMLPEDGAASCNGEIVAKIVNNLGGEAMHVLEKTVYRVDTIEIDPGRCCLLQNGQERYLRLQAFEVLLFLVEQFQRVVSKNELIEAIWRGAAVTDNALAQCIVEIRRALGDDSRQPRFIKTMPKFGYRFIGAIEETKIRSLPPRKLSMYAELNFHGD